MLPCYSSTDMTPTCRSVFSTLLLGCLTGTGACSTPDDAADNEWGQGHAGHGTDDSVSDASVEAWLADAQSPDATDVEAGKPAEPESRLGPIGLAALTPEAFARLAHLRTDEHAHRDSSFDREGQNRDYALSSNFLYVDDKGDQVYVDQRGPGCLYRIWMTQPFNGGIGFGDHQTIQMYFDDEPVPRVSMKLSELFSGSHPPFVAPLVGDESISSGGFFSLVPMPFAKALRITVSNPDDFFYYQFDTHRFDPSVSVSTWTGSEDVSAARAFLSAAGSDPKPPAPRTSATGTLTVPAGSSALLLDTSGPGEIASIHVGVAGVFPVRQTPFADDGRAFGAGGSMSFTVKLDSKNEGAVLQRRLDFGIPDQRVRVLIDGQLAGTWSDRGTAPQFRDNFFPIPAALTAGKSQIAVRLEFQSSAIDWNAFYFWVFSRARGADLLTDTLDVGDTASEAAHAFAIAGETFSGERASVYPSSEELAAPLRNLWIRMTWDGADAPSVEAPLGSFFASGDLGPGFVQGLAAGLHPDGIFYAYWPMPYEKHARIELFNKGTADVADVFFDVRHAPHAGSFENVGYFHSSHHAERPSSPDKLLMFLDTPGAGHVVGLVQTVTGPLHRGQLEGDTRAMLDGRRTPALYGTGTEDEYSGGFYFEHGNFSLPTHGAPNHYVHPNDDATSMYRFFLPDVLPFRDGARITAEHGPLNDVSVDAEMLALYYARPAPRLVLTDTLRIGDDGSEGAHSYVVTNGVFQGKVSSSFEGDDEKTQLEFAARSHQGESRFVLAVDPDNRGVVLRRVFEQKQGRQAAELFVEGQPVGRWHAPGSNPHHALREDEALVPAATTAAKSKIEVRVVWAKDSVAFSEIEYRAYSRRY